MNVTSNGSWLDWLKARQAPISSWADYRRSEALELIASAEQNGTWAQLSRHDNGFVREVAVRELCASASPLALLELIERLNDWVPQIRQLAAAGVRSYLTPAHAPALLFALDALLALAARRRADHRPTLAGVRAALQAPEVRDEVYAGFIARQGKAACYLFEVLLEADPSAEPLLRDALAHRELNVRMAAVTACESLPGEQAVALLQAALPRSIARVRVRALRVLVPVLDDPTPALQQALLDASPSVRSYARWQAPRSGVDAQALLAGQLAGPVPVHKQHWLGVLGLTLELGVPLPETWWRAALRSPSPSVRLCALRLPIEQPANALFELLADDADKVFEAVIARLDALPWATLNPAITACLDTAWHRLPAQRRRRVLQLLAGWQQLAYLLERLDAEPVLEDFWLQEINQWCERRFRVIDSFTPREVRAGLVATLQQLAASGRLDGRCVAHALQ